MIYDIFKEINNIPRPSWHEEKIADWLCNFAETHHLDYDRDAKNCIVIRKPAKAGCENAEPIVLHAHMDMVCVAEKGKTFNPQTDPIEAYIEDGWMKARGTSLGADNGLGLAMALEVMRSNDLVHGPLELFITTNEEDGMTGAAAVSPDFVKARKMIDLDSEDYDTITVGAAGAYLQTAELPLTHEETKPGYDFFVLSIEGGLGGHSGVDIGKGRNNAVKTMGRVLSAIKEACPDLQLCIVNAGEANASIAANAEAVIGVPKENSEIIEAMTGTLLPVNPNDPNMKLACTYAERPANAISDNATDALLECLEALPFGVLKMSEHMAGTVETSSNVGVLKTEKDHFFISAHSRSFVYDDMVALGESICQIFKKYGAKTNFIMSTPAWEENAESDYVHLVEQTFIDVLGFKPRKVQMHFVMEMGYFVEKFPGIEIVPIGPRIIEPHSTSERVELSTVDNIWKVLVELLKRLAQA